MRKLNALLLTVALILLARPAFAELQISQNGTNNGQFRKINLKNGVTINNSGDVTFAALAMSGGTIENTPIGQTTPADGAFNALVAKGPQDTGNSWWAVNNGISFEGTTADGFETIVSAVDPTADQTISIPNNAVNSALLTSTLTTNAVDAANSVWGASNGVVYEGATADTFETTVAPADPTADQTITLPNNAVNSAFVTSTLTTNAVDAANSVWGVSNGVVYEGATADTFETTIAPADPTADQTITIPNNAANSALLTTSLTTNAVDAANSVTGTSNGFIAEGATADAFETTLSFADPTADETITVPATAGAAGTLQAQGATVVITAGATPTLTVPLAVNFIATDTIVTDNQDQTITFSSGGTLGQTCTLVFITDAAGANDEVITLHTTLTNTTGTLTLANLSSNRYVIRLQSDGTVWNEVSRTGAQT